MKKWKKLRVDLKRSTVWNERGKGKKRNTPTEMVIIGCRISAIQLYRDKMQN